MHTTRWHSALRPIKVCSGAVKAAALQVLRLTFTQAQNKRCAWRSLPGERKRTKPSCLGACLAVICALAKGEPNAGRQPSNSSGEAGAGGQVSASFKMTPEMLSS